jgi:UDP-glucose 4-epimerase
MERLAELYKRLYGIDYAALRFFSVYGPHEEAKGAYANIITQFLWSMKTAKAPVIFGDGTQTRDFIFVHDVVQALMMTAQRGTGIFNVGTGKAHSFNEVIDILNSRLGSKLVPEYKENSIENYVMHTLADTEKMRALGFEAKYSLKEGIDKIVGKLQND